MDGYSDNSINIGRETKKKTRSDLPYDNFQCYGGNCSYSQNNYELDDIRSKSRVRIVGQLGLTQDDEYVLNCAATVNDTPIKTNVMNLDNKIDFNQTDDEFIPMITQATQVNFNFPRNIAKKDYKNKTVQCNCNITNSSNIKNFLTETEPEKIELRHCKSPLVVISVYPREDVTENNHTRSHSPAKLTKRIVSPQNKVSNVAIQRSTSPVKRDGERRIENSTIRNNTAHKIKSRSQSPALDNVTKSKSKMIDTKITNTSSNRTKKMNPRRQKSPQKSIHKFIDSKQTSTSKQNINNVFNKVKSAEEQNLKKQRDIRGKDKEQVKRAIVNTFLSNVDGNFFKNNFLDPREDASRVTINIDGDTEKYDVLLEQKNFDTGLTVRKTVKPPNQNKYHKDFNRKQKGNSPITDKQIDRTDNLRDKHRLIRNQMAEKFQQSNNIPKIMTTESRLNVKDSLEICHRRERRKSSHPAFSQKEDGNDNNNHYRNPDILQAVKHYRGDNCSISDPIERDKEIRELLGIIRGKKYHDPENTKINHPTKQEAEVCGRIECAHRLMTKLSFSNLFPIKLRKYKEKPQDYAKVKHDIKNKPDKVTELDNKIIRLKSNRYNEINNVTDDLFHQLKNTNSNKTNLAPWSSQNVTLNRNFQVFLEVEQNNKEMPIKLTKSQYIKVKNSLKDTTSKKLTLEKKKRGNVKKFNVVSIGDIKIRQKLKRPIRFEREIQTETSEIKKIVKCIETQYESNFQMSCQLNSSKESSRIKNKIFHGKEKHFKQTNDPRRIVSSMEIQYASVAYFNHVSVSSTDFGTDAKNSYSVQNVQKNQNPSSLHTIFKGRRKMPTPNLGTSLVSIDSNNTNGANNYINDQLCSGDGKAKKPFLQRLISCLVMRSGQTSNLKDAFKGKIIPSRNSSVDSYRISTSLGAIEMTSSLYDTSASFYSNHTIYPVYKRKRSFFYSVREFLTNRRN